ncbi:hypothetical protein F4861DRAFT_521299, partial [Xylaria intraflava]
KRRKKERTTLGIRWSSPTQLLIQPSPACLWESGRDPEYSSGCGRTWQNRAQLQYKYGRNDPRGGIISPPGSTEAIAETPFAIIQAIDGAFLPSMSTAIVEKVMINN